MCRNFMLFLHRYDLLAGKYYPLVDDIACAFSSLQISLVEFVKNLVQFPFFTSTTRGYLQWVKLLTSVATSGVKGQLLVSVSS